MTMTVSEVVDYFWLKQLLVIKETMWYDVELLQNVVLGS